MTSCVCVYHHDIIHADIETAKALSIQATSSPEHSASSEEREDLLTQLKLPSWPILKLESRSSPSHPPTSPSHNKSNSSYLPSISETATNEMTGQRSPDEAVLGGQSSLWGPLISEEDDLEQAIQLSLREAESTDNGRPMMDISGPNVSGSHDNQEREPLLINLPAELRHLLETSDRTGTHV